MVSNPSYCCGCCCCSLFRSCSFNLSLHGLKRGMSNTHGGRVKSPCSVLLPPVGPRQSLHKVNSKLTTEQRPFCSRVWSEQQAQTLQANSGFRFLWGQGKQQLPFGVVLSQTWKNMLKILESVHGAALPGGSPPPQTKCGAVYRYSRKQCVGGRASFPQLPNNRWMYKCFPACKKINVENITKKKKIK